MSLQPTTLASITRIFDSLDYAALGPIYCDEGGDAFWEERRVGWPGRGGKLAAALGHRLPPGGRSLYVGAGAAAPPPPVLVRAGLHPRVAPAQPRPTDAA